ncbi:hypothetical protein IFM89_001439, partial [Coptis chinensis]
QIRVLELIECEVDDDEIDWLSHFLETGTGAFSPDEADLVEKQEMDLPSAFASLNYLTCLSGFKEMLCGYLPSIQPVLDSVCNEGLQAMAATCSDLSELLVFPAIAWEDSDSPVSEVGLVAISEDHLTSEPMDMGFGAIVTNCPKLRRLALSGLLTDKAFYYIGQYGKLVRTLSVAFAGDTDVALTYVLQVCPEL